MTDHPSRDVLSAFVRGELPAEELRTIVPHLMRPCFECKGVLEMIRQDLEDSRSSTPELSPEEDAAYDAAISRAFKVVRKAHRARQREQVEAARAAGILLPGEGLKAGRKLPRSSGEIARFESLLAQSWSLRHENPSEMVQSAMMALQQAQLLDPGLHGIERVMDLRTRAYAELGNAYRVLEHVDLAADNLTAARNLLKLGSGDERIEIRVLELEASLAADRHRYDIAALYLLRVSEFHLRKGDPHLAVRATISRALYIGYAGRPEEALALFEQTIPRIDAEREPRLVYAVRHNQFLFLAESGQFREAKHFRLLHSSILGRNEGKMNAAGLRSTEALIEAGLGNLVSAELAFRETKHQFEVVGRPYSASVIALNLAAVLLDQGRSQEAYDVALGAAKVFQAFHLGRDAIAALVVLRTAFEVNRATQKLVKTVADFFRDLERNPNITFEIDPE